MSDLATLRQWANENRLTQASLNAEGTSLTLDDASLNSSTKVSISHDGKQCEYTLASLFLQVLDPQISLLKLRQACKKYSVKDPVKPSDKPIVVGFFGLSTEAPAPPPPPPPPQQAQVPRPSSDSSKKRHRGKDRHHHRSSSKDKRSRTSSSAKTKKAPKQIDANALFTNLTTVVNKRSQQKDQEATELHTALSPKGFEVTPDLLQEYTEASQQIQANEIPVGNSASILKASAEKDLSPVLKLYMETMNPSKKSSTSSSHTSSSQKKSWKSYLVGKKPVIILPKGMTAPLTIINAHEFFGKSIFVPRDAMMKRGANKNTIPTTFSRRVGQRFGGGTLEYELMDNPKTKLPTSKDWERVVGVVALGHSWQFKDWPDVYSNPVHLFGKTFGFYIGMEGAKLPQELQGWSIPKQKLNRDKRGLDSVTYASFWNGLDEFMAIHKPELLPQDET
jgi:parafibromin